MIKKFLIGTAVAALALMGLAPAVSATQEGHVKVTICHWANGHPHAISISVSAVEGVDTGHGLLTNINLEADTATLTAHDTPGHEQDSFLHFGKELKNNDVDDDELTDDEKCSDLEDNTGPEGPAGPAGPAGPEGPRGLQGPAGANGDDGQNAEFATILCFPGVGLGFTFEPEKPLPDRSFILAQGAVCPLAGGAGVAGPVGPAGADGAVTSSTTVTTAAPAPASAPAELPRTGFGSTLLWIGLALLLSGLASVGLGKSLKLRGGGGE